MKRDKRPDSVMDQDDIIISGVNGPKSVQHRVLALRPPCDNPFHLVETVFFNYMNATVLDLFRRDHRIDLIDEIGPLKNLHGMCQDRLPIKKQILLVNRSPHPSSHSGGRYQSNFFQLLILSQYSTAESLR